MKHNKANLEGIVSKLKEQGINAGEEEKKRIIENAKKEAEILISEAETLRRNIIDEAKTKAAQTEKNAEMAIVQASRDMMEATKISIHNYLKSVFGNQCKSLFTQQEYLGEITKAVLESISGEKTLKVSPEVQKNMEEFLLKEALHESVELKLLSTSDARIEIENNGNNEVRFVFGAKDVENALFSLLNQDLVERITKNREV